VSPIESISLDLVRKPSLLLFAIGVTACVLASERNPQSTRLWQASGGPIVIEAESTLSTLREGAWERVQDGEASGGAAVIWRGPGTWQEGADDVRPYAPFKEPDSVLTYRFTVDAEGRYLIKLRNRHAREDGDNDVWVSVNGQEYRKYYDWNVNTWTWDETGSWAHQRLKPGEHVLELAGRSHGFAVDRIVIFRDGATDVSEWTDLGREEVWGESP
jgi:hypothetical protein